MGGILGLLASAAIVDNATCPWVFALPVALAAVPLVLTVAFVPHSVEHVETGFEVVGAVLSVVAVGGLVLALHEGPEQGWTAPVTTAAIAAGVLGSLAFVAVERRRAHPLLDVRIFAIRGLAAGAVHLVVVFGVMFSLFLVLAQGIGCALAVAGAWARRVCRSPTSLGARSSRGWPPPCTWRPASAGRGDLHRPPGTQVRRRGRAAAPARRADSRPVARPGGLRTPGLRW